MKFGKGYRNLLCEQDKHKELWLAVRELHRQIAQYLERNSSDKSGLLQIRKTQKVESKNVFGEKDDIQEWEKA